MPVTLEDIPDPDLGDLNHPATVRVNTESSILSPEFIQSVLAPALPEGPLYSSSSALGLALTVSNSGLPNWRGLKVPVKSHLNLHALKQMLKKYPDPWALRGSEYGWPLSRDPALPLSGVTWHNHKSCFQHLDQVNAYFDDEVKFGAIFELGPAPVKIPPPISTIPLLCVPKPPSLSKIRVCGDMSFPPGLSVNDGIPVDQYEGEAYRCRLPSIWDFIAQIREIGLENAVIAKADFSRGYRQLPIDPSDWLLQMFHLPDRGYLMDTRAILGGRPCSLFMQRFHQALAWASMNTSVSLDKSFSASTDPKQHYRACSPYIDDSLLAAHKACAASAWDNLLAVFSAANVQLSTTDDHICPPTRSMRALGFEIDLDAGTISIPVAKLEEMLAYAQNLLQSPYVTRQDLKKLLGRISRCIMVVREGRRFIGRLLLLLQGPPLPPSTRVPLPEGAKDDLKWWLTYGPFVNSKTLITLPPLPLKSVFLVDGRRDSESLPSLGGLCYHTKEFFIMKVPIEFESSPIHIIEAIALLAACRLWVHRLPGGHLIPIGSDNQPVVLAFQFGRAKEPNLASMARLLWGIFATSTSSFYLRYVPSKDNSSDGISRLNQSHVNFLMSQGWSRLTLPDSFFSLNELTPFTYQEEMQLVLHQQVNSYKKSPWPQQSNKPN